MAQRPNIKSRGQTERLEKLAGLRGSPEDHAVTEANLALYREQVQKGLNERALKVHRHAAADIDGLQAALDAAVTATAALAADVAMPVADTWYDGPEVALAAGTWLVSAHVTHRRTTGGGAQVFARITDGTTPRASTQAHADDGVSLTMSAIVVLAAPATLKVQAATSVVGDDLMGAATSALASGANATQITAVRIGA